MLLNYAERKIEKGVDFVLWQYYLWNKSSNAPRVIVWAQASLTNWIDNTDMKWLSADTVHYYVWIGDAATLQCLMQSHAHNGIIHKHFWDFTSSGSFENYI